MFLQRKNVLRILQPVWVYGLTQALRATTQRYVEITFSPAFVGAPNVVVTNYYSSNSSFANMPTVSDLYSGKVRFYLESAPSTAQGVEWLAMGRWK